MARNRTDAKLRFAGVHLTELKTSRRDDCDFDMAHEESFLYHLFGVRDALLQEINLFHGCGLLPEHVNKSSLSDKLAKMNVESRSFRTLKKLEGMKSSWLSIAARMRHLTTHYRDVPRTYYNSSQEDKSACVRLLDPRSGQEMKEGVDIVEQFDKWLGKMKQLVQDLRAKMLGAENG